MPDLLGHPRPGYPRWLPLTERTPAGKRAYVDGFEQGWQFALEWMRRGSTPAEVELNCSAVTDLARRRLPAPAEDNHA
jgi:hypothetical protein